MPDRITNHLTAKAVILAFRHSEAPESAAELAATAGQNRAALERALARLRRGIAERPSPVGERAAASLSQALQLLDRSAAERPLISA